MMIGGALFPDKTNKIVSLKWIPLLRDLDICSRLSWGSAILDSPAFAHPAETFCAFPLCLGSFSFVPYLLCIRFRGDDKWWPVELEYWYDFWHNRRAREHQIQIVPTHYPGWPTKEYADWWVVACCRRFVPGIACCKILKALSCRMMCRQLRLRGGTQLSYRAMRPLADDWCGFSALISGGRVRARPRVSGRMRSRAERMLTRRLSTVDMRTFLRGLGPRIKGDDPVLHEPDVDFFSSADLELARFILHGEGSGSGSAPHASAGGPSRHHRYGLPQDMYEVFSCGEQTIDHIAHKYIASRTSDDAVYRPGPPLQPHPDPAQ
ncbi:hypothetical protein PIB30_084177 [Stylosanthes scabra]|uniref:Aminotransferase-like plant mobile domain-containing protein n=1 Tax=Stylosanthes scabra TaxID=79078 RepID=A0ABU6RSS6_9FABA|nr:hypothetical protein [Stylosanthes scabra]